MSLFDDLLTQTKSQKNPIEPAPTGQVDPLDIATPIVISELTPLVSIAADIVEPPTTPLEAPVAPVITLGADNNSIIFSTELSPMINVATPPAINTIITDPISVIPTIETTPVDKTIETPTTTDSIFADFMSGNDPLVSSPLFDMTPPVVSTPNESIESGVVSQDVSFHNTGELLQHEIREIDRFIGNLDLADATKLTEEDEYRKQKEHYAELELRAETEHKKMLEERSHAEKMRKYLEHEQAGEVVTV